MRVRVGGTTGGRAGGGGRLVCGLALALASTLALAVPAPAAACPGANPCPWVASSAFGRYGVSYFSAQAGVATDSDGNQYLTDFYNGRVIKYSPSGAFVWAVGRHSASGEVGTGDGEFKGPYELRVTGNGSTGQLYVADGFNNRIDELNTSDGSLLRRWGRNGGDGTPGSGDGELNQPVGIGLDPVSHNVYVGECSNNRVSVFSPSGAFITKFGSAGSGNGQFSCPIGVAIDSAGNIYVGDSGNNRVQKFTPGTPPTYAAQAGTFGTANGQFNQPYGEMFDAAGNLLVADAGNNRIQKFDTTLAFISTFGTVGPGNGQFSFPEDVAVDPLGSIHVADNNNNREQKLTSTGVYQDSIVSPKFPNSDPVFSGANWIKVAPDGNIWVSDFYNGRVLKLTPAGTIVVRIGRNFGDGPPGGNAGELNGPTGLALDGTGNLFVADYNQHRINKFNSSGAFLQSFGSYGTANGQFRNPADVAVDGAGDVYVADSGSCRVQEFDASGTFLRRWGRHGGDGSCGTGPAQFVYPQGIAIDPAGHVWVADTGNSRLEEFSAIGDFLATFDGPGTIAGTFDTPTQLAFDAAGELLVADRYNARIQVLDPVDASSALMWGALPANLTPAAGEFGQAGGVAVRSNGDVVVPDTALNRIQDFSFAVPSASAGAATPAATHAALTGTVDPAGAAAGYHFEWGPTGAYGNVTPAAATGPGTGAQAVLATISGLTPNTTYHWRLVASTPAGASASGDQTFTTTAFGAGPPGSPGAGGQAGSGGGQGSPGPAGLAGLGGAPGAAGRDMSVACRGTRAGANVTVLCWLTMALKAGTRVSARVSRAGRLYLSGRFVARHAGRQRIPLRVLRAPAHGRYLGSVLLAPPHGRPATYGWTMRL